MPNPPPFREVARLAVHGTEKIVMEAERRFGPLRTKLSNQEEEDLHDIWTKLTELILQLYQLPSNRSLVKIKPGARRHGPR